MVKIDNNHEIILVDDDEMELHLASRFVRMSNIQNDLLTFDSGNAFLDYLTEVERGQRRIPALVLMDVRMPMLNGFDVVKKVRENPSWREQPKIVMFSNSDEETDMDRAEEAGANAYFVKPADGDAYVAFLNSLT